MYGVLRNDVQVGVTTAWEGIKAIGSTDIWGQADMSLSYGSITQPLESLRE